MYKSYYNLSKKWCDLLSFKFDISVLRTDISQYNLQGEQSSEFGKISGSR